MCTCTWLTGANRYRTDGNIAHFLTPTGCTPLKPGEVSESGKFLSHVRKCFDRSCGADCLSCTVLAALGALSQALPSGFHRDGGPDEDDQNDKDDAIRKENH
jgi:hypothetical protein